MSRLLVNLVFLSVIGCSPKLNGTSFETLLKSSEKVFEGRDDDRLVVMGVARFMNIYATFDGMTADQALEKSYDMRDNQLVLDFELPEEDFEALLTVMLYARSDAQRAQFSSAAEWYEKDPRASSTITFNEMLKYNSPEKQEEVNSAAQRRYQRQRINRAEQRAQARRDLVDKYGHCLTRASDLGAFHTCRDSVPLQNCWEIMAIGGNMEACNEGNASRVMGKCGRFCD